MICKRCNVAMDTEADNPYPVETCPVCGHEYNPYLDGIPWNSDEDYGQGMIDAYEAQARDDAAREHYGLDVNAYYAWKACE